MRSKQGTAQQGLSDQPLLSRRLLEVEGLTVAFPSDGTWLPVVRGVDYWLEAGEILAFVGESGSGKTVTATALMQMGTRLQGARVTGSQHYTRGQSKGDDQDAVNLTTLSERAHRQLRGKEIAYVFQNPSLALNPNQTVGRQLLAAARHHRVPCDMAGVLKAFNEVGLVAPERLFHHYPHQLSGGECQRVMLAQALLFKPRLLIADEPTSAIDEALRGQVLSLFGDLNRRYNMSVLLITHDFHVARQLCHRIAVFYGGVVVEQGLVASVLAKPRHPYTEGLIACAELRAVDELGHLATLEGQALSPKAFTDRCPFYERCPRRGPKCDGPMPPMTGIEDGVGAGAARVGAEVSAGAARAEVAVRCYYPAQ